MIVFLSDCQLGLANGCRARVVAWRFPSNTTFVETTFKGAKVRIPKTTENKPAEIEGVYLRLTSCKITQRIENQPFGLPDNVVFLPRRAIRVDNVNMSKAPNTQRNSCSIIVNQLPIRSADVLTTHAVQGNQYHNYVIAEYDKKTFYVALSRGQDGMNGICINQKITPDFQKPTKQHTEVANEMTSLTKEHQQTIRKYRNFF